MTRVYALMVNADGTFTKRVLQQDTPCFNIAVHVPMKNYFAGESFEPSQPLHQVVRYPRIGTLPNGWVVFGEESAQFKLWTTDQWFRGPDRNTSKEWDQTTESLDRERRDWLTDIIMPGTASPVLWGETRFEQEPGPHQHMYHRCSMGVGRKKDEQSLS